MNDILVLGLGNYILTDEGVGVHAIHWLEKEPLLPEVDLLDGGTGGVYLIGDIERYRHVILIDASLDDYPEGTVRVIQPRYSADYPVKLSAHEFGLKDMIETMMLLGTLPSIYLVTVSVRQVTNVHIGLTPPIEAVLPRVVDTVRHTVEGIRAAVEV